MTVLHTYHHDLVFQEAICAYQMGRGAGLLESWIEQQEKVTDVDQINELIHHLFMVSDTYFAKGSAPTFTKAFAKCKPAGQVDLVGKYPLCPTAWFEKPQYFQELMNMYEQTFCAGSPNEPHSIKVAEHFINESLRTPHGFWHGVKRLYTYVKFEERDAENNLHNLVANTNTWLTHIPGAKEFVQPFCLIIDEEVCFHHVAYAYLNHGMEIEKKILHLYPKAPPEPLAIFQEAALYCQMNTTIPIKEEFSSKKRKI